MHVCLQRRTKTKQGTYTHSQGQHEKQTRIMIILDENDEKRRFFFVSCISRSCSTPPPPGWVSEMVIYCSWVSGLFFHKHPWCLPAFFCVVQERFLASYPARQVASIDLDSTVYAVAAFYLCARKLKVGELFADADARSDSRTPTFC